MQAVFHFLLDLLEPFLLFPVFFPLLPGNLLLMGKLLQPLLHVLAVAHPGHGPPGQSLSTELLHVYNHIGCVLQQQLIVGDVQHRLGTLLNKLLQPLEGLNVQVIGGFVQQVAVRLGQGQQRQAQFHFLPTGKGSHGPVIVEPIHGKPQPLGSSCQLSGGGIQKSRAFTTEFIGGHGGLVGRQLLGEIPQHHAVLLDGAAVLHILLHQCGVIEQLQQGGLAIALLPDNGGLIPGIQREGEIPQQVPQVFFHGDVQISHLQHVKILLWAQKKGPPPCRSRPKYPKEARRDRFPAGCGWGKPRSTAKGNKLSGNPRQRHFQLSQNRGLH